MATIVLAEDDIHILRVVNIWLQRNQHTVIDAINGREAFARVCEHRPDLLITDVNMPVMDGIDLVEACATEGLPKVGTIVLTSRCDQKEIQDRLQAFVVVLHPKPFSPSRLLGEVEALLATAGSGKEPVAHVLESEDQE